MTGFSYVAGLLWLAAWAVPTGLAAHLLVGRLRPDLRGVERLLALAVVFTAGLLWAHIAPLALGVLRRGTVALAALIALAAVAALVRRRGAVTPERAAVRPQEPAAGSVSLALAAVAVACVGAVVVAYLRRYAHLPITGIDPVTFHLPGVATFIQHETLWRIDQFVPGQAQSNYPQNGDVISLAAVLPWHDLFLVRLAMAPFLGLVGVATYALARELGAPATTAAVAGALLGALPIVLIPALGNGLPDAVMLSMFGAGLAFLVRHRRSGRRSDLVLAGVALGISFGSKWYAVSSVGAVLAVWATAGLLERRRPALVARELVALLGLVLLAGGVWLLRNLVESGNPVFPQRVPGLFDAPPDPLREQGGFTVAHYLTGPLEVWRTYLIPQFKIFLGEPAAICAVGALVAVGASLARRRTGRGPVVTGGVLAIVLAGVYSITPFTAFGPVDQPVLAGVNMRYAVPAVLVAAGVAATLGAWAGRARPVLEALGLIAVVLGLRRFEHQPAAELLAVGVVLLAVAWAATRPAWRAVLRRVAPALVLLAVVVAAGAGAVLKERFDDRTYAGLDPAIDWVVSNAPEGRRVGIAGTFTNAGLSPVLPSFGPRLGNEVAYVGPFVRRRLEQYRTPTGFAAAVRRGRFDVLVVGRGEPPREQVPEERWARAAGLLPVARSDRMTVFAAAPAEG